jgi:hypothetical protein
MGAFKFHAGLLDWWRPPQNNSQLMLTERFVSLRKTFVEFHNIWRADGIVIIDIKIHTPEKLS